MSILIALVSIVNLVLSPFTILFFLFFMANKESRYFIPAGTNVNKLKPKPYFIFCFIYVLVVLLLSFLWTLLTNSGNNIWQLYYPKYLWVSIPAWIATVFTLKTYFKGMEGNIMGFIFFPMLLIASIALIAVNFMDIISMDIAINAPKLELNLWLRLAIHAFAPMYLWGLLNDINQKEEGKGQWAVVILTSLILQLVLFGVNWIAIYFFGDNLTISQFFGKGQTVIYYLPMVIGFIYFVGFFLTRKQQLNETLSMIFSLIIFLMVLLQIFNYYNLIKVCF